MKYEEKKKGWYDATISEVTSNRMYHGLGATEVELESNGACNDQSEGKGVQLPQMSCGPAKEVGGLTDAIPLGHGTSSQGSDRDSPPLGLVESDRDGPPLLVDDDEDSDSAVPNLVPWASRTPWSELDSTEDEPDDDDDDY